MNKLHYVYKPSVAHQLLQMGYVIKDVKPQKQEDGSIDYTRCVFLFEDKEGIEYAIRALTRNKKYGQMENLVKRKSGTVQTLPSLPSIKNIGGN